MFWRKQHDTILCTQQKYLPYIGNGCKKYWSHLNNYSKGDNTIKETKISSDMSIVTLRGYLFDLEHIFSLLSNLPSNLFKIELQKQTTYRGKWLIHDTKHLKDNKSHNLKNPCRIS